MRSHRSGADGVVGIDEVFQNAFLEEVPFWTTINASPYRARASRPSAPLKEASRLLLDVPSTPPMSGGEWHARFIHIFFDRLQTLLGHAPFKGGGSRAAAGVVSKRSRSFLFLTLP